MRELKFRAFNEAGMGQPFTLREISTYDPAVNGKTSWPVSTIFMQFTGLKDKNSFDLYDQDIIQTDQGTLFIIEFNQQEMQWVLYQANEGSRRDLQGEVFALKAYMVPNITLKGNCYQNPDLLKP